MGETNSVCVHVRRGDYLKYQRYNVCGEDYFKKAVKAAKAVLEKPCFYIFSDDIEWCKSFFTGNEFVFCSKESNADYEDLRLMYSCKHFIISNSTFSWWAQYLGNYPDKEVFAPGRWLNDKENLETDIYLQGWNIVA